MPNEIYHRSEWGNPKAEGFGDVYFDASATNKLYNHSDNYENSDGTDKILRDIPNKASIVLTPTAYSDGSLNTVIPPYQVLPQELVTNGTFDTDSDWNKDDSWSISNGTANYNYISGRNMNSSTASLVVGKTYKLVYTLLDYVSGSVENSSAETQIQRNSNGTYTEYFIARFTFLRFRGSSGGEFSIDNVSVKEIQQADFDFSRGSSATRVNEKGLIEDVASNIPRIDYTSGQGALLLEPQSTNLVTYSEQFGGQTDYFNVYNQSSQVSNNNLAPDGTNTATQIVSTGAGKLQTNYISLPANTTYTLSFYAKNVDATEVYSRILADGGSGGSNLTSVSYISQINTSTWNRITHIFTTNSTSQSYILYLSSALNSGGNIQLWGAQLEQQSYATSYIPTEGSTVTRSADVANNSGNADLINSTEGVLYAEIAALNDDTQQQIGIYGSSISKQVRIVITNSIIKAQLYNGAYQANMSSTQTVTDFNKIAFKYKENDFALWVNGIEVANDNVGSTFPANDLDKVNLTSQDGSYLSAQANVKSVAVFKEALTDAELQALTT
jgi:hypothetical protein